MATISMSGNDTLTLNNHIFADFADGTPVELTFPNDIAAVKTGKNGNGIYALSESGRQCEMKIRVLRASTDDKYLSGLLVTQMADFAGTVLLNGTFTKVVGDGTGKKTNDQYVLGGGVFTKIPEAKMNTDGDTEQSVATYTIKFTNSPRAIG